MALLGAAVEGGIDEAARAVDFGGGGGIFVVGSMAPGAQLRSSAGGPTLTAAGSAGTDAFVACVDAAGVPQWLLPLAGPGTEYAKDVVADGAGRAWVCGTVTAPLPATGPDPALSLLPGGGAPIDSVAWAADGLARAGYVVIVTRPASGGSLAACDTAARSGIDFLLSPANPFAAATCSHCVGVAGWSLGARALTRSLEEDARVSAPVAWDHLALNETGGAGSSDCSGSNPPSTRRPRVPAPGQAPDFCGPPAETVETK